MPVETLTIKGTAHTTEELEALLGIDALEPPYDIPQLQQLIDDANDDSSPAIAALLAALVIVALLPNQTQSRLTYVLREQRYYQGRRALTQVDLQTRVSAEGLRNAERMRRYTQDMIDERMSLEQWQQWMGRDIVRSHLRMAQSGVGTAGNLTPAHLAALRQRLRLEMDALSRFAGQIQAGQLSERMMLYRAELYGTNAGATFWESQWVNHKDGRWEARRFLDPNSRHCVSCPGHYQPNWVSADEVVPVGSACECGGRCRCRVEYRAANLSDRLPSA